MLNRGQYKFALFVTSVILTTILAFLLGEALAYFAFLASGDDRSFTAFNGPYVHYRRSSGTAMDPGVHRIVRVISGSVEFDSSFMVNSSGYATSREFQTAKRTHKNRFIVLGDSFSAGINLKEPWPDVAQRMLDERATGEVELYSFSLSGAGLFNWHSLFFNEIAGKYEFDGLIIATLTDDLLREFTISQAVGAKTYLGRFSTIPKDDLDFEKNYLPKMLQAYDVMTDEEINERIRRTQPPLFAVGYKYSFPILPSLLYNVLEAPLKKHFSRSSKDHNKGLLDSPRLLSPKYLRHTYKNLYMLDDIISWCKQNNKPVLICYIPLKDNVLAMLRDQNHSMGIDNRSQLDILSIADMYGTSYFNGLKAFEEYRVQDIYDRLWHKRDGHWDQGGSDAFARAVRDFILDRWIPAIDRNDTANNLGPDNYLNRAAPYSVLKTPRGD